MHDCVRDCPSIWQSVAGGEIARRHLSSLLLLSPFLKRAATGPTDHRRSAQPVGRPRCPGSTPHAAQSSRSRWVYPGNYGRAGHRSVFGSSLGGPTPTNRSFEAPMGSPFHFDGTEHGNVWEWGFLAFSWPLAATLLNRGFCLRVVRIGHSLSQEYRFPRTMMMTGRRSRQVG